MQFAFTGIVFMPLLLLSAETVASIYHLLVLYAPGQMITEILWAFQLSLYCGKPCSSTTTGPSAGPASRTSKVRSLRRYCSIRQASPIEGIQAVAPPPAAALACLRGSADDPSVQFLCEDVDLAGQLGVGFKLEFLSFKVVVGFGLLEGGLSVLADHDECRQKDRFK